MNEKSIVYIKRALAEMRRACDKADTDNLAARLNKVITELEKILADT